MPLEELFASFFIGLIGVLFGAFITPHIGHIFQKRLTLSKAVLDRKIAAYEKFTSDAIATHQFAAEFYRSLWSEMNRDEIKNEIKKYLRLATFSSKNINIYGNQEIVNKTYEFLGKIIDFYEKMILAETIRNELDRNTEISKHLDLLLNAGRDLKDLLVLIRNDIGVDKINFDESIFKPNLPKRISSPQRTQDQETSAHKSEGTS